MQHIFGENVDTENLRQEKKVYVISKWTHWKH